MFVSPGQVAFQVGSVTIFWYGLCMACAILLGIFTSVKIAAKFYPKANIEAFYDLMFYVLIGGIIGARLYFVAFDWSYFGSHFADIPKLWTGGLSIHGAILGGFLVGLFYVKKQKLNLWMYADITAFGLCVGQIVGRLGNFFNSEAFGAPTNLPWKLYIPLFNRPEGYEHFEYFHPTFLYEMVANAFIVLLLFSILKNRPQREYGMVFFLYLILYSIARILIECIRIDSVFNLAGVPIAIWMSGALVFAGLVGLFAILRKKKGV